MNYTAVQAYQPALLPPLSLNEHRCAQLSLCVTPKFKLPTILYLQNTASSGGSHKNSFITDYYIGAIERVGGGVETHDSTDQNLTEKKKKEGKNQFNITLYKKPQRKTTIHGLEEQDTDWICTNPIRPEEFSIFFPCILQLIAAFHWDKEILRAW